MGAEGGVHWGRIEVWLGVAWERLGCGCGCGWGSPGSGWGCGWGCDWRCGWGRPVSVWGAGGSEVLFFPQAGLKSYVFAGGKKFGWKWMTG